MSLNEKLQLLAKLMGEVENGYDSRPYSFDIKVDSRTSEVTIHTGAVDVAKGEDLEEMVDELIEARVAKLKMKIESRMAEHKKDLDRMTALLK